MGGVRRPGAPISVEKRGFLFPPTRSTMWVARRCGLRGVKPLLLSTLPGRVAWACLQRRRVPLLMIRARSWRIPPPVIGKTSAGERKAFGGAALTMVAPGEREALRDLVSSIRRYEGDAVKIVVVDGLTGEYPPEVARTFPGVDFVRPRVPGGSRYCPFRGLQVGLLHLLENYEVPAILKLDPDALVIGAGSFELAAKRFEADPGIGVLGTTAVQADGSRTDYRFNSWMAHPELRWSRRFRRLVRRAEATPPPYLAHAGACFYSPRALRAALSQGLLPYRQPAWSLQGDDMTIGLIVRAAGFRVASFGAPGEPIACGHSSLPLEPAEALAQGFKVVHSVRRSPSGLSEEAVREAFRAERTRRSTRRASLIEPRAI